MEGFVLCIGGVLLLLFDDCGVGEGGDEYWLLD